MVCGNPAYIGKYDMVRDVKPGGIFLLNCDWEGGGAGGPSACGDQSGPLPRKQIKFYTCDAVNIARKIG